MFLYVPILKNKYSIVEFYVFLRYVSTVYTCALRSTGSHYAPRDVIVDTHLEGKCSTHLFPQKLVSSGDNQMNSSAIMYRGNAIDVIW